MSRREQGLGRSGALAAISARPVAAGAPLLQQPPIAVVARPELG